MGLGADPVAAAGGAGGELAVAPDDVVELLAGPVPATTAGVDAHGFGAQRLGRVEVAEGQAVVLLALGGVVFPEVAAVGVVVGEGQSALLERFLYSSDELGREILLRVAPEQAVPDV